MLPLHATLPPLAGGRNPMLNLEHFQRQTQSITAHAQEGFQPQFTRQHLAQVLVGNPLFESRSRFGDQARSSRQTVHKAASFAPSTAEDQPGSR
jgi:hypothetical protein